MTLICRGHYNTTTVHGHYIEHRRELFPFKKMKSEEHIQFWIESAAHDLDAAESLFAAGKYDWCLFLGHLVLEKTLKAILAKKQSEKIPPKTHNLVKLAEKSSLELTDDQKLIRREVNRSGVLGGERFKEEIEAALARRVRPGKAGRPKAQSDTSANIAKQELLLL